MPFFILGLFHENGVDFKRVAIITNVTHMFCLLLDLGLTQSDKQLILFRRFCR